MTITRSPYKPQDEQKLMSEIWDPQISEDPYAFVMHIFPWGKANTPLERFKGPRTWQRDKLQAIADHIRSNKERMARGEPPKVFQDATVSGRGVGKSAFFSMIDYWMMSCNLGSTSIVTANTEDQLKYKTWAELGKWHTLALNSHWFDKMALSLKPAPWFEELLKKQLKLDTGYYYSSAQLWSEEKPDAFAGVHNFNGILLVMDEASGIPKPIWTVSEGFFTEPVLHRYWFAFSNGRRNTGPFFECFHANRFYWRGLQLDSRTVEGTDHVYLHSIVDKHGEESDEAAVEVKGQFPSQGDNQFISRDLVENATQREVVEDNHAPLMMGVDIARYGNDSTVIRFRQGRNARVLPPIEMKGADNMAVANKCAELILKYNPDAVCIDSGNGTGVIDRLKEMGYRVHEIGFGNKSPEPSYANNRTYLWAQMRDWLGGGCIDASLDLKTDLVSPQYKFMGQGDRIRLETKEELKHRGFASPDHGDALACTFAVKVARRDLRSSKHSRQARIAKGVDYRVFG